jgi:hypothetical protein
MASEAGFSKAGAVVVTGFCGRSKNSAEALAVTA